MASKAASMAQRVPIVSNYRINPGLRHQSRLWTKPTAWKRKIPFYPEIQIKRVKNHPGADPQLLIFLNEAKQIFSAQLPNMGGGYIARQVFDYEAETEFLMREGIIVSAIISRIFVIEAFLEIVFCAADATYQSRGYTRMTMNYLKFVIQSYPIFDIITCADNEAVIFFQKQGFNEKAIMMDPDRWVGRIKDYEGITLVHCQIRDDIDYMKFPQTLEKQRTFLNSLIGNHFIKAPPELADAYQETPTSPTCVSMSMAKVMAYTDSKIPRGEIDEAKVANAQSKAEENLVHFKSILGSLMSEQLLADVFGKPVTEDIAPGYFQTIKKPMDFETMSNRLSRHQDYYKSPEVFASDMYLMCENCRTFNTVDDPYYRAANTAYSRFTQLYNIEFPENSLP